MKINTSHATYPFPATAGEPTYSHPPNAQCVNALRSFAPESQGRTRVCCIHTAFANNYGCQQYGSTEPLVPGIGGKGYSYQLHEPCQAHAF